MAENNVWVLFALGSAFFASLTTIFGKLAVSDINSNLATLIRTGVIFIMIFCVVAARHDWQSLSKTPRFGLGMLVLSAIASGLSWLCYYRALQLGDASRVAPVDVLSVALIVVFAVLFLGESLTWKTALGSVLVTLGAILVSA